MRSLATRSLKEREGWEATEYSRAPFTATARLAGMVHGVVVQIATRRPSW